jgi:leucyl-tRNA synthetase
MGHAIDDPISLAPYPEYDVSLVDNNAEAAEELIDSILSDVEEIIKVTGITPSKVIIYTAAPWKTKMFNRALSMHVEGKLNPGALIAESMQKPEMKKYGKEIPKFSKKVVQDIKSMNCEKFRIMSGFTLTEKEALDEANAFLEKELDCKVEVFKEGDNPYDPENKARFAAPFRPAIYIV